MEIADFGSFFLAFRQGGKGVARKHHHVVVFQKSGLVPNRELKKRVTDHAFQSVRKFCVEPLFDESRKLARLGERPSRKRDLLPFEAHRIEIEAPLVEIRGGYVGTCGFRGHYVESFGASAIEKKVVENADFRFGHIVWGGILSAESYTSLILCKAYGR